MSETIQAHYKKAILTYFLLLKANVENVEGGGGGGGVFYYYLLYEAGVFFLFEEKP